MATAAVLLVAHPAHADVPLGWGPPEQTDGTDFLTVLWLLIGIPLALILLIVAAIYLPAIARGESVKPGADRQADAEWLGGPRRAPSELAAPDGENSQAGGASGRW